MPCINQKRTAPTRPITPARPNAFMDEPRVAAFVVVGLAEVAAAVPVECVEVPEAAAEEAPGAAGVAAGLDAEPPAAALDVAAAVRQLMSLFGWIVKVDVNACSPVPSLTATLMEVPAWRSASQVYDVSLVSGKVRSGVAAGCPPGMIVRK